MLEKNDPRELVAEAIDRVDCEVELPADWTDYFDLSGALQGNLDEQRRFHRFYLRQRAMLDWRGTTSCVYTSDISRSGVSFLHARQLFPREPCTLWMLEGKQLHLSVARCLRVNSNCYECGATFRTEQDADWGQVLLEKIPRA